MTAESSIDENPLPAPAGTAWRYWTAVAVGLVVLVGACVFLWTRSSGAEPPRLVLADDQQILQAALEEARQAVIRLPRSAQAWGQYGMLLRAHDFETPALECFAEASRLDPAAFRWPYYLGVSTVMAEPRRALAYFARAAELSPQEPLPQFRLAELLMDFHQLPEAHAVLEKLPANADPHRVSYDRVRWWLLSGGRPQWDSAAAEAVFQQQVEQLRSGPNRKACLELLAQVEQRLGHTSAALELSESATNLAESHGGWSDPLVQDIMELRRDPAWQGYLAQADLEQGRIEQGLDRLEELQSVDPLNPQWPVLLIRALMQQRRYQAADRLLSQALAAHVTSAELRLEAGNLQFLQQNWEQARHYYQAAIDLKPDYARAYFNRGQAEFKLAMYSEATTSFRRSVQIQPDLLPAHCALIEALIQSGRTEHEAEIERHLELATGLGPANPQLKALKRKLEQNR